MKFNLIRNQQIELITNFIIKYIYDHETSIILNDLNSIEKAINACINNIKLSDSDYTHINKAIINRLLINENFSAIHEAKQILKEMSSTSIKYDIDYSIDSKDITLYFHLENNQSYLINYDNIDKNWYISLIETNSLELIKEIYNDTYPSFISFIKEKVAK